MRTSGAEFLDHGFARLRCAGCAFEHLVPFSCKGRGFCPSCGGRRMTEHAAHLVDTVLPRVPVRQWVRTLPYPLRYRLAWDHGLTRAVLGVYARVLQDTYVRGAHRRGIGRGRTGMLTVIQRFGSGVNLNVHFHTLVLDGVFAELAPGRLKFHAAPPPSDADVAEVLRAIRHRVGRAHARRGLESREAGLDLSDGPAEVSPVLAQIISASVQGRVAIGRRAGVRVRRLGREPTELALAARGPRQAQVDGFDLHANVRVPPTIGPGCSICADICSALPWPRTGSGSGRTPEKLCTRLADVPTPAGPTPRELEGGARPPATGAGPTPPT